ncbi:MAG: TonB-dependent receptor plug domain-containing protein [Asticcacaulis sp.]|uniref:TonB-dependent receptor plug domain-containing protein n=1 Tax=Asticcacaulis sp. TaxID=1872648 RepID=UPI003F7B3BBE
MRHSLRLLTTTAAVTLAVLGIGLPAYADGAAAATTVSSSSGGQVVSYKPAYFAQYQVATAFDMVLHVPGFVFDGGESARGFSGTAGNVVIDGQRPTTKADLGNTLSNINADQVDHLELITGGAPGMDMHGHRQIVNIVRKKDAKPNFSVLGIVRNMDGRTNAGVLLFTFNANRDGRSTDITADIFNFFDNGAQNARRITTDASGATPMAIYEHAGGTGIESQASHSEPLFGGKITFNGTYNPSIYRQTADYVQDGDAGHEHYIEKDMPSELGGQYERKFGHGLDLNLNLLRRYERDNIIDSYVDSSGASDYLALSRSRENILNGRLGWEKSDRLSFAIGAESAYNRLDRATTITLDTGAFDDDVRVEENRTESFISSSWKATRKLNFEGEIRVETSTISVPAANRSDSFVYVKPRFQAVYALSDKTKLSWKTIRQVDQLSFSSFANSVQLQTSHVTLGNTALVPQKDWLNTLILEHNFWDKGAVSLAYEHYDYEDTSDFIAVFDGADVYTASGNIGKAQSDVLHAKLDTPLDKLFVPHGSLSLEYYYRNTRVKDPITGDERHISGVEPHVYSASFSQEFPKSHTSWGVDLESNNKDRNYLANEIDDSFFNPWSQVWFQYVTPKKVTFKIAVKNPLALRYTQDRWVYSGLRGSSPIAYTQHTTSKVPPMLEIRLKKDF